jgi:hypothetical protein
MKKLCPADSCDRQFYYLGYDLFRSYVFIDHRIDSFIHNNFINCVTRLFSYFPDRFELFSHDSPSTLSLADKYEQHCPSIEINIKKSYTIFKQQMFFADKQQVCHAA